MGGWADLEEYNQFMQKINGWSEELLLRGLSQFTIRDIEVLEQAHSGILAVADEFPA